MRCLGGKPPPGQGSVSDFAHGSTYSKGKFRYLLVCEMACSKRPFALVKDWPLVKTWQMMNAQIKVPSDDSVSRDVQRVYQWARPRIKELIKVLSTLYFLLMPLLKLPCQAIPNRIHLVWDGWTSPNVISVLGLNIVFWDKDQLKVIALDVIK